MRIKTECKNPNGYLSKFIVKEGEHIDDSPDDVCRQCNGLGYTIKEISLLDYLSLARKPNEFIRW